MRWLRGVRLWNGWIETASIGGLLLAIAVAGLVGLGINVGVRNVTERALKYDVELEDRGDDFRVAVLDVRHYHRNLVFTGPSRRGLAHYEAAYLRLHRQIDELEQLGIDEPDILSPEQLRERATRYYDEFRPAIDLYTTDPQAFTAASDEGLMRIAELEGAAQEIDRLGERRAAAALRSVEVAAATAQLMLLAVLVGLVLVGIVLAGAAIRVLRAQKKTSAALTHALQLKTDFIADASHELRTPLTVLRANAEVALDLERTCVHTELLEEIVHESQRMARLVEDLLFLARSDSDSLPLEVEVVDLGSFLAELAERADILVGEYGASFSTELAAAGLVRIDRARIEQAVLILVDNAAKYSPPGGTVTLRATTNDAEAIVEVSDRGPGIPEAALSLVFERFYRVDKARTRKQGGTGLGLSIAKSIIEAHEGRIEVESSVNKGTKMRVCIPYIHPPISASETYLNYFEYL